MANAPLMRRARGGMLHLRFDRRIKWALSSAEALVDPLVFQDPPCKV
jgi:hypothetical protein